MSYQDVYNLGTDPQFHNRLSAALTTEAVAKTDDALADQVLRNPDATALWFMPFISSAPGFAEAYATGGQESITDGQMLSAVQAAWPKVADLYSSVLVPTA